MLKAKAISMDPTGNTDGHIQKWKVDLQRNSPQSTPSIISLTQIKFMKAGTPQALVIFPTFL